MIKAGKMVVDQRFRYLRICEGRREIRRERGQRNERGERTWASFVRMKK